MTLLAGWPSRNVTVYFHISIHKTSYTESTFISQEIRKPERIETIYQFLIKQLYWLCIRLSHINSLSFVLKTHKFLRFTWLWRQCQGGTVESVRAYVFAVCSKWDFELLLFVIQSAIISYEVVFSNFELYLRLKYQVIVLDWKKGGLNGQSRILFVYTSQSLNWLIFVKEIYLWQD